MKKNMGQLLKALLDGPNFSGDDIPNKKNDVKVTVEFTDNADIPEEVKAERPDFADPKIMEGRVAVVMVLDNEGVIHKGIMGGCSPLDIALLMAATDELKQDLAKSGLRMMRENRE